MLNPQFESNKSKTKKFPGWPRVKQAENKTPANLNIFRLLHPYQKIEMGDSPNHRKNSRPVEVEKTSPVK
jgi:hypothetical protein